MSIDINKESTQHGTHDGIEWAVRPIDAYCLDYTAPKGGKVYNGYARIPEGSPLFRLIMEDKVEDVIGGDITYIGDDGWIGFDEYLAAETEKVHAAGEEPFVWSVETIVEETLRLCERIALAQRTAEAFA